MVKQKAAQGGDWSERGHRGGGNLSLISGIFRERDVVCWAQTGDNRGVALAVAREVGIHAQDVHADLLPADKAAAIRGWQVYNF